MKSKTFYILFETDLHKSKRSRIFLGVFSSSEIANQFAKEKNCYSNQSEVVILEAELNQFQEM